NATNYWVDVVFTTTVVADTQPPAVTAVTPAADATGVATGTTVRVTFSEPLAAATVSGSTVELRTSSQVTVAGSVAYEASTRTATLTPNAALAPASTYTVSVRGGSGGVTDVAGNALAATFTSSFTTAAPAVCPCTIWSASSAPAVADSGDASGVEL